MKKQTFILYIAAFVVASTMLLGLSRLKELSESNSDLRKSNRELERNIESSYQLINVLNASDVLLRDSIKRLNEKEAKVIIKWQTILKPVQTFSFTQTSSVLSKQINAACELNLQEKSIVIEHDTFALFNTEQNRCILTAFYEREMYSELYTVADLKYQTCMDVVANRDSVIVLAEGIIDAKDMQLDNYKKQLRNSNKGKRQWMFSTVAAVALAVWGWVR